MLSDLFLLCYCEHSNITVLLIILAYTCVFLCTNQAFTPVTLLLVLWAFNVEIPSLRVVQSVCVIAFGTILSTASAPSLSIPGLLFVFGAEIAEAMRLVLTQSLLVDHEFSVLEGQYFLAPVASAALLTLAVTIEIPKAQALSSNGDRDSHGLGKLTTGTEMDQNEILAPLDAIAQSPELFLAASIVGVLVNYLGYFVIREVGSLTLKILGTFRNLGLIAYGLLFLREVLAPMQCVGYAVSLIAFVAYSYFKTLPSAQGAVSTQAIDAETKQTGVDSHENDISAPQERSLSWESDASDFESALDSPKNPSPSPPPKIVSLQLDAMAEGGSRFYAPEIQAKIDKTPIDEAAVGPARKSRGESDEYFELGSV